MPKTQVSKYWKWCGAVNWCFKFERWGRFVARGCNPLTFNQSSQVDRVWSRGEYMTYSWTRACHPVFRKLPYSNCQNLSLIPTFTMTLGRKLPIFEWFCKFLPNTPMSMFKEIRREREPCLENFRPKIPPPPCERHIPISSNFCVHPPGDLSQVEPHHLRHHDSGLQTPL